MLGLLGTPFRSVAIHSIIDEGLNCFGGLFAAFRGEYPRNWLYNRYWQSLLVTIRDMHICSVLNAQFLDQSHSLVKKPFTNHHGSTNYSKTSKSLVYLVYLLISCFFIAQIQTFPFCCGDFTYDREGSPPKMSKNCRSSEVIAWVCNLQTLYCPWNSTSPCTFLKI